MNDKDGNQYQTSVTFSEKFYYNVHIYFAYIYNVHIGTYNKHILHNELKGMACVYRQSSELSCSIDQNIFLSSIFYREALNIFEIISTKKTIALAIQP